MISISRDEVVPASGNKEAELKQMQERIDKLEANVKANRVSQEALEILKKQIAEKENQLRDAEAGLKLAKEESQKQIEDLTAQLGKMKEEYSALAVKVAQQDMASLGTLICAVGPIEMGVMSMEDKKEPTINWSGCTVGEKAKPQNYLRTKEKAKASFMLSDGSEMRLNEKTVLAFNDARDIELQSGELWLRVKPDKTGFTVRTRDGKVTVTGTEIDVIVDAGKTVLSVLSGKALLHSEKGLSVEVGTGETGITEARTQPTKTQLGVQKIDEMTRWTVDLIMTRGRDDPELVKRVNDLLVNMGEAKAEFMTEEEIRSYGTACVIPLAKYIDDPKSSEKPYVRKRAVKILSDIGDWYAVSTFIGLLEDKDSEIRAWSHSGLTRITAQDLGYDKAGWTKWWDQNRSNHVSDNIDQIWNKVKKKIKPEK